jgi:DNA processing protein
MEVNKLTLSAPDYPEKLRHIAGPPGQLYFCCTQDVKELFMRPCVTIVGSRKVSAYGISVTSGLAGELARAGVVIISGLALGVDSVAHMAALDAGGLTIAVLPSGLANIYPARHNGLARRIVAQGGAVVTEYDETVRPQKWQFIARNRIAAGLCDALLITEAAAKSGSLHTAQFALEQGKTVLAVPGNITSPMSSGTNNLIKSGALPVTNADDILLTLGRTPTEKKKAPTGADLQEQILLDLLFSGIQDGDELLKKSKLDVSLFNQTLTMLEIRGHIRALGSNQWGLL